VNIIKHELMLIFTRDI